ncbi:MAG: hypothetical protein WAW02_02360 [Sideroxyarcus sp.]
MNKGFILAIILVAAILGFGYATGYFTETPPPEVPHVQTVVPAPVTQSVQIASQPVVDSSAPTPIPRINLDAALGPLPKTIFTTDEKHAIARYDFGITKNPAENNPESVGLISSGMLVEVLEKREKCLTVPLPNKPKSKNPQEESDEYEDPYAGKTLNCYKVKKNDKEGWVVDRDALNFQVPTPTRDPRDLTWFFQKYGETTWYYEQGLNENSFTNEEYERLLMLALSEASYAGDVPNMALRLTLIKALEKNPDDPRLAGFKDKVKALEQARPY